MAVLLLREAGLHLRVHPNEGGRQLGGVLAAAPVGVAAEGREVGEHAEVLPVHLLQLLRRRVCHRRDVQQRRKPPPEPCLC